MRARAAIGAALVLASIGAAVTQSCLIVNGLEVPKDASAFSDAPPAPGDDGGDEGGCRHAYPPARPTGLPEVDGTTVFLSAVRAVDLGSRDSGAPMPIGYDLDGVCSADGPGQSCRPPEAGAAGDFDGGLDDNGVYLAQDALNDLNRDYSDDLTTNFKSGTHGLLLWVADYNGGAEDANVRVGIVVSPGTEDGGKPLFADGDTWAYDDDEVTMAGGSLDPVTTIKGYVTGNTLVAQGAFKLQVLPGAALDLLGYVTATIAPRAGGGFYLSHGFISGRCAITDGIEFLGGVGVGGDGGHLCDDPKYAVAFITLKGEMCDRRDIMIDQGADNRGQACDAISFGIAFTGAPAIFGSARAPSATVYCPDADLGCPAE